MATKEWDRMKFFITMHMPSNANARREDTTPKLVHQMIVSATGASSLEEFRATLEDANFVTVTEYFKDNTFDTSPLKAQGEIVINTNHVGKVKEYKERS